MNRGKRGDVNLLSYTDALNYIQKPRKEQIDLGLERMIALLGYIGNPEKSLKFIHIAGTNGKGSTLNYMASVLQEAGYDVGLFTSPYVNKSTEQIKINDLEMTEKDFVNIVQRLKPVIDKMEQSVLGRPTEFEIFVAMAIVYFAEKKPNIVLFETGLGGRLDATNVITPIVSMITNIGYDHMNFLGDTLVEIACEKAGIIKRGVPTVSGCKQPDVQLVIRQTATRQHVLLTQLGTDFALEKVGESYTFYSNQVSIPGITLSMLGNHQVKNAALALEAIQLLIKRHHFQISEAQMRRGLQKTKVTNRIEVVESSPTLIFDGGHNPDGTQALVDALQMHYEGKRIYVLFCAMKDKKIVEMINGLKQIASKIILTTFPFERAMEPNEVMVNFIHDETIFVDENWEDAFTHYYNRLKKDDVLVVTGSLYFLNEVRQKLKK